MPSHPRSRKRRIGTDSAGSLAIRQTRACTVVGDVRRNVNASYPRGGGPGIGTGMPATMKQERQEPEAT